MQFFRFYGAKKDVKVILDRVIPNEWVFTSYKLTEALRDDVSNGTLPIMVLVRDDKAAAKVRLTVNEGPGPDWVRIKQVDEVTDDEETRKSALYGQKSQSYPWETLPDSRHEMFEWYKRDGYLILQPGQHSDLGQFVEHKTQLTDDDIEGVIDAPAEHFGDIRIDKHKACAFVRSESSITKSHGWTEKPDFPTELNGQPRNYAIERFFKLTDSLNNRAKTMAVYGPVILLVGKAK